MHLYERTIGCVEFFFKTSRHGVEENTLYKTINVIGVSEISKFFVKLRVDTINYFRDAVYCCGA